MAHRLVYIILIVLSVTLDSICIPVRDDNRLESEEYSYEIESDNAKLNETDSSLKIVGGSNALAHAAPWIVSLQLASRQRNRYHHACGGAILSPEWILTAGHCMGSPQRRIEVSAGRHDLYTDEHSTEQRRQIFRTFVHPNYKGGVAPNDIALIQLQTPLIMTAVIGKVNLPNEVVKMSPQGLAKLYGWGSTSNTKQPTMPNVLQTMTASIISGELCQNILHAGSLISDTTICTGPMDGRLSACMGDSGSALTQGETIIGIVSWGMDPCGYSASVYTRVSMYRNWILGTVAKEGRFGKSL